MDIKPYQINQLIATYGDVSLSELIPLVTTGKDYVCPACGGSGTVTDPENPPALIEDTVCEGYGKTLYELELQPCSNPVYVPIIPPDPPEE